MNKKYIFIGILFVILFHYLLYLLGTMKVTARFEELEPFKHNIPVYYKGFKLGSTTNIRPGKDYQSTLIDMRIKKKGIKLPANIEIVIKRKDKKDYIELIYPNRPYIEYLKNNSIMDGHIGVNFENFLQDQAQNGGLDEIKNNVNSTVISAGETFNALTEMLNVMTAILNDIRPSINETVKNVNIASNNLASLSNNLKTTINKGYIDSTLYNFQEISNNLVLTSENFGGFTDSLNKKSNILLNCLLKNANIVICNINEIITGLGNTLKKRFGGIRLFFGKTIS